MTTPNLTPAPAAPQRSDPSTFAARGDSFLTWWVSFVTDLSAAIAWINDSLTSISSSSNYWNNSNAVSASTINCALGVYFTKTVAGAITFTFSNPPASGKAYSFTLRVIHTAGAITWASPVRWSGGGPSDFSTGKVHLFVFSTDDGGINWRGSVVPNFSG